ncbi:MAG: GNAT family N-acetyltransferase [Vulcanimicrobiaceae bacterium]
MIQDRHSLQSARLRLEPTTAKHAAQVCDELIDPRLWRFFPELRPASLAQVQALYQRWERGNPDPDTLEQWENWVCFLKGTGTPVGSAQATITGDGSALIAYMFYVQWQGCGYAREAAAAVINHLCEVHQVKRVLADMNTRNAASIRVVESLGFLRIDERPATLSGPDQSDYVYELLLT